MKKRNYGIDILKLFAMFYILILHINGRGGLLNTNNGSKEYIVALVIEIICLCAANIYGIASGYLFYSKYEENSNNAYSFKGLIYLWIQVVFYSLVTTLILVALGEIKITGKKLLMIFLPVSTTYSWYFTAYFLMFFFIPIINIFVKKADNKIILSTLIPIILFFGLYQSFVKDYIGNFTFTNEGYSVWWLIILFYIGAVIKKLNIGKNTSSETLISLLIIIYIISFSWKYYVPLISKTNRDLFYFKDFLFEYISPSNLFAAIIYVILFTRINIKSIFLKKILPILSKATFGVYIMHIHPYIWYKLKNSFIFILNYNIVFEPILVIIFALVGLSIMLTIDIIRSKLFKILKIDILCEKISKLIDNINNNITEKLLIK